MTWVELGFYWFLLSLNELTGGLCVLAFSELGCYFFGYLSVSICLSELPRSFLERDGGVRGGGVGTFGLKKKKIMVSFVTKQYPPPKKTKKLAPPFKKTDRNHGNRIFILRVRNVSF